MLGTLQDGISMQMRDLAPVGTHTRVAQLYDETPKLWCSDSYKRMAVKGINSIGGVCRDIQKSGGAQTLR